jgi:hypothetical protein
MMIPVKIIRQLLILIILFFPFAGEAQKLRYGIELAPQISWLNTNDVAISNAGLLQGFSMGTNLEYSLSHWWKIQAGLELAINQGGKLQYHAAGNYLIHSELKIPVFNSGPVPIAAGNELRYELKTVAGNISLKRVLRSTETWKTFVEVPRLSLMKILSTRGAIFDNKEAIALNENIFPDVFPWQLAAGFAVGYERRFGRSAAWYLTAEWEKTLTDITRNGGLKTIQISSGDPFIRK